MTQLPLEVLKITFEYLEKKELLQCQLTNKLWHEASSSLIYSNVTLKSSNQLKLYTRTITQSSQLAAYLKYIDTDSLFSSTQKKGLWDEDGFWDALIRQCSSIKDIAGVDMHLSFWMKLSYSATQSQLACLQKIPLPSSRCLESYIYTALNLRESLNTLQIRDHEGLYGSDLFRLNAFQILRNQIQQFRRLVFLVLIYFSKKRISDFDKLLDECPKLEDFRLYLYAEPGRENIVEEAEAIVIHPHLNIFRLYCFWECINHDSQLYYIMKKFPNLEELSISIKKRGTTMPQNSNVLIDFLRYAMDRDFLQMEVELSMDNLIDVWKQLAIENILDGNLVLYYLFKEPTLHNPSVYISGDDMSIKLPPNFINANLLPHVKLLSGVGNMVQSLELLFLGSNHGQVRSPVCLGVLNTFDIVFNCLKLCPSLEKLTLYSFKKDASRNKTRLNHDNLKSLTILDNYCKKYYDCIDYLATYLPNLKNVNIRTDYFEKEVPMTVNIPTASLDTFTWEYSYRAKNEEETWPILFRLYINNSEKLYMYFDGNLTPTVCRQLSLKHTRIEIICKNIKELAITTHLPSNTARIIL